MVVKFSHFFIFSTTKNVCTSSFSSHGTFVLVWLLLVLAKLTTRDRPSTYCTTQAAGTMSLSD